MPPRHPRPAARRRPAAIPRAARHVRPAVGLHRLDQQQEHHQAARLHGRARRGRGRRAERPRAAVGPGRTRLPRPPGRARRGGRAGTGPARGCARLGIARATGAEFPVEPAVVGDGRRACCRRGRPRRVAGRPVATSASRSPGGRRCCRRSTGSSTTAAAPSTSSSSTTSWRCTSPPRNGAGATTPCRCCTATGWSARSTPSPTARRALLVVHAVHQDVPFTAAMTADDRPGDRRPRRLARARPAQAGVSMAIERPCANSRRPTPPSCRCPIRSPASCLMFFPDIRSDACW